MTTTQAPQRPTESLSTSAGDRKRVIVVAGAAAVVVTVLAVILLVGYVPLPDFPQLADDPDPSIPGMVAFLHDAGEARCIALVPAAGGPATDVVCRADLEVTELAWTDEGLLAFTTYASQGPQVVLIDPQTGSELDRMRWREPEDGAIWSAQRAQRDDGARLLYEQRLGGEAAVRIRQPDGAIREVFQVRGPADYAIASAQWSPDGAWILVTDSRGRLIVVAAEGEPAPRILLTESEGFPAAAWSIAGDSTYTVAPIAP